MNREKREERRERKKILEKKKAKRRRMKRGKKQEKRERREEENNIEIQTLSSSSAGQFRPARYFRVPIQNLPDLQHNHNMPFIVPRCVEHIRQHGKREEKQTHD